MTPIVLYILEIIYVICLVGLAIFGLNSLLMTVLFFRARYFKPHLDKPELPAHLKDWPAVTIQVPIFNERYTVERFINALHKLNYPHNKLQVQVLDDSTDDTVQIVSNLVTKLKEEGMNIDHVHRTNRSGFKAGALKEGLTTASGELIAVFDADFLPEPNWLKKTVAYFLDPSLGCLQTRWGHLNSNYDAFSRAISLGIDGHFVVEQTARSKNGLFLNFNGTAGLWRRTCIEDAGGWCSDTLTEDLDLSYRAQLKGWRFDFLPDVVVPAELPVQVEAFKKQQFRWAKGSFQVVKKILPTLLSADIPDSVRILGVIHITGYFVHPLMLLTMILMLPIGWYAPQYLKMLPWSMLAAFGPPIMYLVSRSESAPTLWERLSRLPLMILVGFGLTVNNTVAIWHGLFDRTVGTFVRTPKFNMSNTRTEWAKSGYSRVPLSGMIWIELGLALYTLVTIAILVPRLGLSVAPWLLLYTISYLYIAIANIRQNVEVNLSQHSLRSAAVKE